MLKDIVSISKDLLRINSYLLNGQCIHAHRHAVQLRGQLGTANEANQILEYLIRNIYDGKQIAAESSIKKLNEILNDAFRDIVGHLQPSDDKTTQQPA